MVKSLATLLVTLVLLPAFGLTGCSSNEERDALEENWSVERLYSEAKGHLEEGDYLRAIELYSKLEARFPFGKYARQALLDIAYAHYLSEEPDAALAAASRFLKIYPQDPHVDYVWYLKGLVNFNRSKGLAQRYLPTDESQRDSGSSMRAFQDFLQLVTLYPNSKYVEDVRERMRYLRNALARHEVNVASYYMRRGAFLAAVNRASYVVQNYPRAPAIPDALAVMARSYKVLEMSDLSRDALRVLEMNYPDHPGIFEIEDLELE